MSWFPSWLIWLLTAGIAGGKVFPLPERGFEQNLGQYGSHVLFALDQRILYPDRVQFASSLTVQFAGANPSPSRTRADGSPVFLTLFSYVSGGRLASDQRGNL